MTAATPADPRIAALVAEPALRQLLAVLDSDGEETRIVGGAVRNALMDRPVSDVDCATTALPEEVMRRAKAAGFKPVPTGIDHGTVTVVVRGTPFEVTTLRQDVETDGRRAQVAFGRDFGADARRRDFTMNAIYADRTGRLHDPVGGLADLAARRVRFIGDADTRIREDFLRILRFFRFHADYGEGPLDRAGLTAAIREREGLDRLSHERVRAELMKLLAARRAVETVETVADTGFLDRLLAGIGERGRFARIVALEAQAGRPADAVLRLAALAVATAEDADRLRDRLRLSNAEHARLSALGRLLPALHDAPDPIDARSLRRLTVTQGLDLVSDALAILAGERRPVLLPDAQAMLSRLRSGEEQVPVFPLRGRDAVAAGAAKGPQVGAVLARARAMWLDADCPAEAAVIEEILTRALAARDT